MAKLFPRTPYETDGSLAYKVGDEVVSQPRPHLRPLTAVRRKEIRMRKAEAVSPFTLCGAAALFFIAFAVIASLVQLNAQNAALVNLDSSVTQLQSQYTQLHTQYEAIYSDEVVQAAAAKYGMTLPESGQVVYVDLALPDQAVVYPEQNAAQEFLARVGSDLTLAADGVLSLLG